MQSGSDSGMAAMVQLLARMPEDLVQGFRAGRRQSDDFSSKYASWVLTGMGGSAIAGDLLMCVTDRESRFGGRVVRGSSLPQSVGGQTLAILTSYSGNTWETLGAFEEAGRRGCGRIAITSGGKLRERAEAEGVPVILVPGGYPPRSAVGHLLGSLVGLVSPVLGDRTESRLKSISSALRKRELELADPGSIAHGLARRVGRSEPFVYVDSGLLGVARRWKTQVEENAKRLSAFDSIPELFHNSLVPWDKMSRVTGSHHSVILLTWVGSDPRVADRFEYLSRLLERKGVRVSNVALGQEDVLAAVINGVWTGDHFSLELARQGSVDPLPVDAIDRMKHALA